MREVMKLSSHLATQINKLIALHQDFDIHNSKPSPELKTQYYALMDSIRSETAVLLTLLARTGMLAVRVDHEALNPNSKSSLIQVTDAGGFGFCIFEADRKAGYHWIETGESQTS